jgi:hypothetical protein
MEASRRRGELREDDGEHLTEVRQRVFTAVVLPVGVGDEADRGVESQPWTYAGDAIRIQRQQLLDFQDHEQDGEHREVRDQHRLDVGRPALVFD